MQKGSDFFGSYRCEYDKANIYRSADFGKRGMVPRFRAALIDGGNSEYFPGREDESAFPEIYITASPIMVLPSTIDLTENCAGMVEKC